MKTFHLFILGLLSGFTRRMAGWFFARYARIERQRVEVQLGKNFIYDNPLRPDMGLSHRNLDISAKVEDRNERVLIDRQ
jgi:hypothetical protein